MPKLKPYNSCCCNYRFVWQITTCFAEIRGLRNGLHTTIMISCCHRQWCSQKKLRISNNDYKIAPGCRCCRSGSRWVWIDNTYTATDGYSCHYREVSMYSIGIISTRRMNSRLNSMSRLWAFRQSSRPCVRMSTQSYCTVAIHTGHTYMVAFKPFW